MNKRKAIIVDIDGTVADSRHRVHHIVNPEGKVNWPAWDADAHLDPPIGWVIELVNKFAMDGYSIIFVTGRGERLREVTIEWLKKHISSLSKESDILVRYLEKDAEGDLLQMRPEGDHRPDTVVKAEIYKAVIEPEYDVLFAIDDKASVVDMWRALGVPCLECDRWTAEMEASANHYVKKEHVKS